VRFLEERRRPLSVTGDFLHALATRTGFLAFAGVVAISVSGCAVKGADNANLIVGKQAFVAKCGSCHTMARAET
jgi:mono/diheme cytochrome c family protein